MDNKAAQIAIGFGAGVVAAFIGTGIGMIFMEAAMVIFGLFQLIGLIPLLVFFGVKKFWGMFQGALLCGIVAFLLNAGCWALVAATLSH